MNTINKTHFIAAALVATLIAAFAATLAPHAGEMIAGLAVFGALVGMGVLETKKRAY